MFIRSVSQSTNNYWTDRIEDLYKPPRWMNLNEFDEFSFSATMRLNFVAQSEMSQTTGITGFWIVNTRVCCLCGAHKNKNKPWE